MTQTHDETGGSTRADTTGNPEDNLPRFITHPEKADKWLLFALFAMGAFSLAMIPLRAWMLSHPAVYTLAVGGYTSAVVSGANASVGNGHWLIFLLGTVIGALQNVAGQVSSFGGQLTILVIALTFLVFDIPGISRRRATIARLRPRLADSLDSFGDGLKSYWIVATVFGLIVAVMDVVALQILGVPLALVWGVLAFVTNYIPNIGFVLGLIPPAFIALLSGGVSTMVWVIVIYCVANFVIQTILQPKFTGDAVGINATTAFLSLMFWAYVFGALGALLAIPFTLLFKSLLIDRDPNNRWVNQFIASSPREGTSAQPL